MLNSSMLRLRLEQLSNRLKADLLLEGHLIFAELSLGTIWAILSEKGEKNQHFQAQTNSAKQS